LTARALCDSAVGAKSQKLITLGRISGVFGVKGWVKVHSYTEPRDNVVRFAVWTLHQRGVESTMEIEDGRSHGANVVAKLRGVESPERARELLGGETLGIVDHLVATGANDVLVLAGAPQRLVPFVMGEVIRSVDLDAGVIVADWSPEF
jgi:16S rRNA processing protein RimM